jgi:hypothetical protein
MKKTTVYLPETLKCALARRVYRPEYFSEEDAAEAMEIVESFCDLRSVAY